MVQCAIAEENRSNRNGVERQSPANVLQLLMSGSSYMRTSVLAILAAATLAVAAPVSAQSVKHLQNSNPGGIADGVWAGDTLYLSGQLPSPSKAADRAAGTPAVWGTTTEQADSAFQKIQTLLKA